MAAEDNALVIALLIVFALMLSAVFAASAMKKRRVIVVRRRAAPKEDFWTQHVVDQDPIRRVHAAGVPSKPWGDVYAPEAVNGLSTSRKMAIPPEAGEATLLTAGFHGLPLDGRFSR